MQNNKIPQQYGAPYPYRQKKVCTYMSESRYRMMFLPVCIYSIVCAICLYRNWSGMMTPVLAIISSLFISFSLLKYEKHRAGQQNEEITISDMLRKQRKLIPYFSGIISFGIAVCLTDDVRIILICNICILVLEVFGILSYFNNVKRWGISKAIAAFFEVTLIAPFEYIAAPFIDGAAVKKRNGKKKNKGIYVLIGIGITVPILVIVLKLLAEADEVFESVMNAVFGSFLFSPHIIFFSLFAWIIFMFVYALAVKLPRHDINYSDSRRLNYEPVIGITITGILTLFYLVFSVIQVLFLFMNNMTLPDNMSYAEYARSGFFQLLFVAVVNLIIVLFCMKLFKRSRILNIVLTVMCICTYIMIVSSAVRMVMYIKEYDLTYARVMVLLMLLMTALLMTGVLIKIFCESLPLFNYSFIVIMSMLLLFAFSKPASLIARYNLNHERAGKDIDISYILQLGSDAVPAACEYFEDKGYSADFVIRERSYGRDITVEYYLNRVIKNNEKYGTIRGFNFSRYAATKYAKDFLGQYPGLDKY